MTAALEGRYALERELGRGGMATVYLAIDLKLHRQVALKVLRPELAASLGNDRFLREIEIAARLSHPHILPLHDSGDAGGHLYYAMPYVEGESLRQRVEREGQLPIGEVIAIVRAVASALSYAHQQGIIHRDIKPENILLAKDPSGGPVHPLVADFGIARAVDAAGGEGLTETGLALGTPAYMSPEQAAAGRLDGRSDIYALGCVAYEMLAGSPPFTGPTAQAILARHAVDPVPPLHTVRSTVPIAIERAIEQALAKVPADRFATADKFAQALTAEHQHGRRSRRQVTRKAKLLLAIVGGAAGTATAAMLLRGSPVAIVPSATAMAVLPFFATGADTSLARLGRDLAVTVSASIDGVGGIATSDRLSVAQEVGEPKALSVQDAAGVARRLGASSFLRGTLVQAGQNVRLDLGLYQTDRITPLAEGITVTAHRDSIGTLTDSAAWALLRQIWKRGEPPSPSLAAVTTRSLPALRAFLDGEREIEKDDWEAASLAFSSAIAADSTFWLAYFRYALAQYWREQDVDSQVNAALQRHRDVFPERERMLIDAWNTDGPREFERYRALTRRFPDYWPGWFMLGDRIYHMGPLHGVDLKESQAAFGRAVSLNPRLKPAWIHLLWFGWREDTIESKRALAQVLAFSGSDSFNQPAEHQLQRHRIMRMLETLGRTGGIIGPKLSPLADSVARDWASLEATPPRRQLAPWALLWCGFPVATIDWNRRVLRSEPRLQYPASLLRGIAWAWAERGAWDSALPAIHQAIEAQAHPQDPRPPTAMDEYGLAVLGSWLGAIAPAEATVRRAAAVALSKRIADEDSKRELRGSLAWLDGMLAFSRGDHEGLEKARRDGHNSGHKNASMIERSLAAFSRALRGDRAAAGRELAAMEWGWLRADYADFVTPNVAIHRIAAATWLLEAGDTAQAARLLTWHQSTAISGWEASFTYVVTPLAYLMLGRIYEAQGESRTTIENYKQFLRRYDSPMPKQRHLVDEANAALQRFSGTGATGNPESEIPSQ